MEEYRGTKENPIHISCGGIVYQKDVKRDIKVLLLHRFKKLGWAYDSWHLPKGTKWKGEKEEETVKREVLEETGWEVEVLDKIGTLESIYTINNTLINKTTHYYLCKPLKEKTHSDIEHDEVKWVNLEEAISLVSKFPEYEKEEDILEMFKTASKSLSL